MAAVIGERDSGAPPMARKEIGKPQLKALFAVCGNQCAMHDVEPPCTGYSLVQDDKFMGEVAHIAAAEEGGKRYDYNMDDEQRNANPNLIILCRNHHILVDRDEEKYTTAYLLERKRLHESGSGSDYEPPEAAMNEAVTQINQIITVTSINSSSGTQNNATSTNAGSGTQTNNVFHGPVFLMGDGGMTAGLLPLANMGSVASPVINRTLTLVIGERLANMPVLLGEITANVPCYSFDFNGKEFVVQTTAILGDVGAHTTAGADRRHGFNVESAVSLLKSTRLYDNDQVYIETLFNEVRSVARADSLRVVITGTTDLITDMPFHQLTEIDFEIENAIQFMQTAGGRS